MSAPEFPDADHLLAIVEDLAGRHLSTFEIGTVLTSLKSAWSIAPVLVPVAGHDAARRAALAVWLCARGGLLPGLIDAVAAYALTAWGATLRPTDIPDRVYDDVILEVLRRPDHENADVQRDAWWLLHAELYALVAPPLSG